MRGLDRRIRACECLGLGLARHGPRLLVRDRHRATASEPDTDPVGPEDLATTVYHQLGIVADKELMAPGGRPIEICDGGKVVKGLLA